MKKILWYTMYDVCVLLLISICVYLSSPIISFTNGFNFRILGGTYNNRMRRNLDRLSVNGFHGFSNFKRILYTSKQSIPLVPSNGYRTSPIMRVDSSKNTVSTDMVNISGYVLRKRTVSKNLTFIDLAIHGLCSDIYLTNNLRQGDVDGDYTLSSNHLYKNNSDIDDRHPKSPHVAAVQVLLGATLIRRLGMENAHVVMRTVSVGQLVQLYGCKQPNPRNNRLTDVVTYDISVLGWGGKNVGAVPVLPLEVKGKAEISTDKSDYSSWNRMILDDRTPAYRNMESLKEEQAKLRALLVADLLNSPRMSTESVETEAEDGTASRHSSDSSDLSFLELDIGPHRVHVVDDLASLATMKCALDTLKLNAETNQWSTSDSGTSTANVPLRGAEVAVVGFDCEWQPEGNYSSYKARRKAAATAATTLQANCSLFSEDEDDTNSSSSSSGSSKAARRRSVRSSDVCLLQIATRTDVFVVDLVRLCVKRQDVSTAAAMMHHQASEISVAERVLDEILGSLFQSSAILKVGLGPVNDLKRLAWSHWNLRGCRVIRSVLDVQHLAARAHPGAPKTALDGLSKLCVLQLGRRVNKEAQCSNWAYRPLAPFEIDYAALDAFVLTKLFDTLFDNIPCKSDVAARKMLRSLCTDYTIYFPTITSGGSSCLTNSSTSSLINSSTSSRLNASHPLASSIDNGTITSSCFMPLSDVRIVAGRR